MGSVETRSNKVALITGGASGFGLAIATALVQRGDWNVHLVDLNDTAGVKVAKDLGPNASFHKVNVAVYSEMAQAFDDIFRAEGRLDFVFGNAGIVERLNLYEEHDPSKPPPELDMRVVDINLKAVYVTSYLALHYLRQSPGPDRSLILTSSCGGLYATPGSAMYSGAKHGVVGFTRSIAGKYKESGIRVNCICPGTVHTGLLEDAAWKTFIQDYFTPISTIVDTLLKLIDGDTIVDAKGLEVKSGSVYGKAVEINMEKFYIRDQPDFCDEVMAALMGSTVRDNIKETS